MKEFEKVIEQVFEYTHEYAFKNLDLKRDNPPVNWTKEEKNKFTEYVHIGFKKAQELVLNELLSYEIQIEELNYIFKRDFNQTILQMRSDNKELFEKASLEIASL